jgi:hypothetical protein
MLKLVVGKVTAGFRKMKYVSNNVKQTSRMASPYPKSPHAMGNMKNLCDL